MDQQSLCFNGRPGSTYPAREFATEDYLLDARRFPSEGNWGFCRFPEGDILAARLGFQRGSFNISEKPLKEDPSLFQLHLEMITSEGAFLWIPTGEYPADGLESDPDRMAVSFRHRGKTLLTMEGWPDMRWHFTSSDDEMEMDLRFGIDTVTVLPDCVLPQAVFAMWETMGSAEGQIRYQSKTTPVSGAVFYDHPRVCPPPTPGHPRNLYIYTTMSFEDGSGMFGYHAEDPEGKPLDSYCFGVYIHPGGRGDFLPRATLRELSYDSDNIACKWAMRWENDDMSVESTISVRPSQIIRGWGSSSAPSARKDFIALPLVLDGSAEVSSGTATRRLTGYGLAEYFNSRVWYG